MWQEGSGGWYRTAESASVKVFENSRASNVPTGRVQASLTSFFASFPWPCYLSEKTEPAAPFSRFPPTPAHSSPMIHAPPTHTPNYSPTEPSSNTFYPLPFSRDSPHGLRLSGSVPFGKGGLPWQKPHEWKMCVEDNGIHLSHPTPPRNSET